MFICYDFCLFVSILGKYISMFSDFVSISQSLPSQLPIGTPSPPAICRAPWVNLLITLFSVANIYLLMKQFISRKYILLINLLQISIFDHETFLLSQMYFYSSTCFAVANISICSSNCSDVAKTFLLVNLFFSVKGRRQKKNGKKAVRLIAWVDPPSPSPEAVRKM